MDYEKNTKGKIFAHKTEMIKKMAKRADYTDCMSLWEIKNNKLYAGTATKGDNA